MWLHDAHQGDVAAGGGLDAPVRHPPALEAVLLERVDVVLGQVPGQRQERQREGPAAGEAEHRRTTGLARAGHLDDVGVARQRARAAPHPSGERAERRVLEDVRGRAGRRRGGSARGRASPRRTASRRRARRSPRRGAHPGGPAPRPRSARRRAPTGRTRPRPSRSRSLGAPGSSARSTLPRSFRGSSVIGTIDAGTMYSGRRSRSARRRRRGRRGPVPRTADDVGDQPGDGGRVDLRRDDRVVHLGDRAERRLDLTRLDEVPADLHGVVGTAEQHEPTVRLDRGRGRPGARSAMPSVAGASGPFGGLLRRTPVARRSGRRRRRRARRSPPGRRGCRPRGARALLAGQRPPGGDDALGHRRRPGPTGQYATQPVSLEPNAFRSSVSGRGAGGRRRCRRR